jgi:hypothetical protein
LEEVREDAFFATGFFATTLPARLEPPRPPVAEAFAAGFRRLTAEASAGINIHANATTTAKIAVLISLS